MIEKYSIAGIASMDLMKRPEIDFPWRPDIMALEPAIDFAVDQAGLRLVTYCMLAGIVERESNFQNIFQQGVPRGPGCGVGPCQITAGVDWTDLDHPTYNGLDLTVPKNNLLVAVRYFLVPALQAFPDSHQAAFAAYNLGVGGVQAELATGESPDANTTGKNYGASVMHNWITYASIMLGVTPDWGTWAPS